MASVKRRPDGKWRARYRDVDGRERAKHTTTKREAEAWLHERMAAQQRGEHIDHGAARQTVRDYFDAWSVRQVWEPPTLASYQTMMKGCTFADVPLARVQRSHVESWVKTLQSRGLAPRTVRQRHSYIANMLGAATRDRVIAHNPATGVALPRLPKRESEMAIPTSEQVSVLLDAIQPQLRAAVAAAAFAGLRIGEVCALQLDDVKFLSRTLHVRRQVRPGGDVVPPKFESVRAIAAPDTLIEILARHVEVHGVSSDGWLFPGRFGGPASSSATRRAWIAALEPGWSFDFHDLRHFYASGLIAAGCDVVTVQRALGHSTPSITLNTYSHLWPTAEDRTRAAAEDLARAVCGPSADQTPPLPSVSGVSASRG